MSETNALVELYKDTAQENRKHAKRWFLFSLFSNIMWAVVVLVMVIGFLIWDSQFEYIDGATTTETEVTQETSGDGNNVYQAGEYATYNEGGE